MKLRVLTDLSTNRGAHEAGSILEIADDVEARVLILKGLAEEVEAESAHEAAMLDDAPERATLHRARPRGV